MHRKTANTVLTKKFNNWVESIKDDDVKKLVKENTIITGGCIASLLLGEKVNDYDIYFKDQETAYRVALYYKNIFNNHEYVTKKIESVGQEKDRVKIIIPSAGVAKVGKSGGYQFFETIQDENEQARQVEEYVGDVTDIGATVQNSAEYEDYTPVFVSSNAITLTKKIQLVFRFFGPAKELHKNFDFVHCTGYWTSKHKNIVITKDALESLLSKHLVYMNSLYPLSAVIRTRKFIKRGWHINAGQYLKMLFAVSELDLTDMKVLEEQLTGVDAFYFKQIIDALKKECKEDPNFSVDYTYLATLIDKIF